MSLRADAGAVTVETTLAITALVPVLFAVLQFGAAFTRWQAQDTIAVQAARHAGELGGDSPAVRSGIERALRAGGIDPAGVTVTIEPATVGWREPVRVALRSDAPIVIPFLFQTTLPLRSSAIARGEVAR